MPGSGISGSYGDFISSIYGICILSSIVAVSVYIPTLLDINFLTDKFLLLFGCFLLSVF